MQTLSQLRKANLQNLTFNWQRFHKRGEIRSKTFSSAEHANKRLKHGVLLSAESPATTSYWSAFSSPSLPRDKSNNRRRAISSAEALRGFLRWVISSALTSHSGLYNEPTTNERSNLNWHGRINYVILIHVPIYACTFYTCILIHSIH